jgi:hypothetical protein
MINFVVSVGFKVPFSSLISAGLILATADLAFSKAGKAAASSLSAYSFSIIIVFFCLIHASVTPATSKALISAFLFSISSSPRRAAV